MNIKFKGKNGGFSDDYYTGWLGSNIQLSYADIDGDNQPYSATHVKKNVRGTPLGIEKTLIFDMDHFFAGADVARERVVYLGKCVYHGIAPILTDWEKKNLTWGEGRRLARKPEPTFSLHGIFVRGTYFCERYGVYVEVKYIANAVARTGKAIDDLMGVPQVVFEDIFTGSIYCRSVTDFNTIGFKLVGNE